MQVGSKTMKNVVFMGSKEIGLFCFDYLIKTAKVLNYNVLGLLTNSRGMELKAIAEQNSIRILDNLKEYLMLKDVDICISVQYHKILKKNHLAVAKINSFNLHMAPIPEYRGCNQFSFAIYNQEKEFGTSLHIMEAKIDGGKLIAEKRFKIPNRIWVEDLLHLTIEHSKELFTENLKSIIDNTFKLQNQNLLGRQERYYARNDINHLKIIDLNSSKDEIERKIRATYMPGFDTPYFIIDNKKINLTIT